jgi:hypothetical protein
MKRRLAGALSRSRIDPLATWPADRATLLHIASGLAAIVLVALFGSTGLASAVAAVAFLAAGLLVAPVISLSLVVIAAHVPALLTGHALGPLSAVDLLLLAILARTAPELLRRRPVRDQRTGLVLIGLALVCGGLATATAPEDSAVTAYLRLATYVAAGTIAVLHRTAPEHDRILATLVGVVAGDSLAAIAHVSPTIDTGLPIGRYIGTLGDPSQFGIAVAIALLLIIGRTRLVPSKRLSWGLTAVLAIALVGSGTRSAWAGFAVGFVVWCAFVLVRRGLAWRWRFLSGLVFGGALVAGLAAVTVAAPALGLQAGSISVRSESLSGAFDFLAAHPLQPIGLGNDASVFPTYNTWLALALALGVPTMLLFAGYVGWALRRAVRLQATALTLALIAVIVTTTAENQLFAGSSLTLTWMLLLGIAAAIVDGPPVAMAATVCDAERDAALVTQ